MPEQSERILDALYDHTVDGDEEAVLASTKDALELGVDPSTILFDSLIPALEEVGRLFEEGTYFVPEMIVAARAMRESMQILEPLILVDGLEPVGKFVMGTVKGDIHDIGKNLCNVMLEGAGFEVVDLGVNVAPEAFVEALREHEPDALGICAFLTTTMGMLKLTLERIEEAGLRDEALIYVGGAPVTQEYCDQVGADGYAANASALVRDLKARLGISVGTP